MRKLRSLAQALIVLLTGCTTSVAALAVPCTVLQYEEMKDMSAQELTKEYCSAIRTADENTSSALDMMLAKHRDEAAVQLASTQGDECRNQASRIARALQRKGIDHPDKKLHEVLCKAKSN